MKVADGPILPFHSGSEDLWLTRQRDQSLSLLSNCISSPVPFSTNTDLLRGPSHTIIKQLDGQYCSLYLSLAVHRSNSTPRRLMLTWSAQRRLTRHCSFHLRCSQSFGSATGRTVSNSSYFGAFGCSVLGSVTCCSNSYHFASCVGTTESLSWVGCTALPVWPASRISTVRHNSLTYWASCLYSLCFDMLATSHPLLLRCCCCCCPWWDSCWYSSNAASLLCPGLMWWAAGDLYLSLT